MNTNPATTARNLRREAEQHRATADALLPVLDFVEDRLADSIKANRPVVEIDTLRAELNRLEERIGDLAHSATLAEDDADALDAVRI